ncbi:ketopantoate reductase family protein [Falsiroseomonas tokyonensis]|uniref:2-dehydropantoate 2-reductase n=1 Tax=Falsiroseomonas tokyonensis TaxID=430521 RepID=A0ABV7BXF6_9PROT|nr:2-dehydropantoate 2-reductase [Falsiroseomonas tokyonensis]MBU8539181.1 2-dehydropantoate 2-reductase [Falsiroseomonas tokyonensis]
MRICIFGAGAIGGFIAAYMARAGIEVSVVARGAHLAAIQAKGLTVETRDESFTAQVRASADPAELGPQDGVFVTVKAPALPGVAGQLAPLLGPETPVTFLTNGIPWWYFRGHGGEWDGRPLPTLDPGEAIWSAIGPRRLVGGIAWPASSVPEPGLIRMIDPRSRPTILGAPDGSDMPGARLLAQALETATLPVVIDNRIRDRIWEKLAFNLSAGPLTVLTETPVRATQVEPALVEASRRILAEVAALIAALGCRAEIDVARILDQNSRLGHRPSVLQDLQARRPMEVEALYNVPLELAALTGVPMPTLEMLAALIRVKAREYGLA